MSCLSRPKNVPHSKANMYFASTIFVFDISCIMTICVLPIVLINTHYTNIFDHANKTYELFLDTTNIR